jgi:hypothetical protein
MLMVVLFAVQMVQDFTNKGHKQFYWYRLDTSMTLHDTQQKEQQQHVAVQQQQQQQQQQPQ